MSSSSKRQIDFAAGSNQIIRVQPTEYRGKKYVDVRKFFDKDGEWMPTGKGISIPLEEAASVAQAIIKMQKEHAVVAEEVSEYYSVMELSEAKHFLSKKTVVIFDEDELVDSVSQAKNTWEPEVRTVIVRLKMKKMKGTEIHCLVTSICYQGNSKSWRQV